MKTKKCTKCKLEKALEQFRGYFSNALGRMRYRSDCRECESASKQAYRESPEGKQATQDYISRPEVKAKKSAWAKSDEGKAYHNAYNATWRAKPENKAKRREYNKDIKVRFSNAIRNNVRRGFTMERKNELTEKILGLPFEVALAEIQKRSPAVFGEEGVHVHHIVPIATARKGREAEDIKELNHWTNLRFITGEENMRLGASLPKADELPDDLNPAVLVMFKEAMNNEKHD